MSVVISDSLVVDPGADNLDGNSPIIGYVNRVTTTNIAATTEDASFPVTNVANVNTAQRWKSGEGSPSSEEYITVTLAGGDAVDYVGIARHNFGTTKAAVSVEGVIDEPGSPADWFELTSPVTLDDDGPVIFRFNPQSLYAVRLRIQESVAASPATPYLGVMYVGLLLLVQRRIWANHVPVNLGRQLRFANLRSISSDFLGTVVLGETRRTQIALSNLTESWYRSYFEPFVAYAEQNPWFWAWRPSDYPLDCGFVWLTSDVQPVNQRGVRWRSDILQPDGLVSVTLDVEGVS